MIDFWKAWTAVEAIRQLYFYDSILPTNEVREKALDQTIKLKLGGVAATRSVLSTNEFAVIESAVASIKNVVPEVRHDTQLHPLLWMRWAFRRPGSAISASLMQEFSTWRAKFKPQSLILVRRRMPDGRWGGHVHKFRSFIKAYGYTLDQFLSRESFKYDGKTYDEYKVDWKIRRTTMTVTAVKKLSPRRTIKKISGSRLVELLGQRVDEVARSGNGQYLSTTKVGNKYISHIPKIQLIRILSEDTPDLGKGGYSEKNIARALQSLVRCQRGRPRFNSVDKP